MRSKKTIFATFSVFVIISSFIVFHVDNDSVYAKVSKSLLIRNDIENIIKNCNRGEQIYCEFEKITNKALKGEDESVMLSMEKLEKRGEELNSYPIDCHGLAHTIGKIFFYHIGLTQAILKKNICTAGIYHGAFEEWGTNSNLQSVKKEIPFLCVGKDKKTAAYRLCIHGTGRALYRSTEDIIASVDACSDSFKNNEEDQQNCFTGVLSSYILMEFAKKNEIESEYINKLFDDCLKINEKYQSTCISISIMEFIKQKYLWRMPIDVLDKLLIELNKYVILCENLNSPTKRACAHGVGNSTVEIIAGFESEFFKGSSDNNMSSNNKSDFKVVSKEDILKSLKVCNSFKEELLGFCVSGAASWVLGHLGDTSLADELCSVSKTNPICLNLKNNYNSYTKLN